MPSPYQTNCFDYNKIGCKSRSECVDKCLIEMSLKECNSLNSFTNVDRHNDKDIYNESECIRHLNTKVCEDKYESSDCLNEYFSFKPFTDLTLNESLYFKMMMDNYVEKRFNQTLQQLNINAFTVITLLFGGEPDTIYRHSPQQPPIEFICFIGGVISLWTGFSVLSLYAYGKRFFVRQTKNSDELFVKLPIKNRINNCNCKCKCKY